MAVFSTVRWPNYQTHTILQESNKRSVNHEKKNHTLIERFFILTVVLLLFVFIAAHSFAEFYVISGSRGVGTEKVVKAQRGEVDLPS